jgi:hypothetical protein
MSHAWVARAGGGTLVLCSLACSASIGTWVDERNIPQVLLCKTTKSEVLQLFGEPFTRGVVEDFQFWHWSFARDSATGDLQVQDLYITMDRRDVVVDLAYNPPSSDYPKNRCAPSVDDRRSPVAR